MKKVKEWLVRAFKGFTLIELLVVVIIIGILAAIGIPQYTKTIEKARGAEGTSGLGHIQEGEKLHYVEEEVYVAGATAAAINGLLDINITDSQWEFAVVIGAVDGVAAQGFLATASRRKGKCQDTATNTNVMYMDHCGNLADHATDVYCPATAACGSTACVASAAGVTLWGDCVDGL